jgi:HK97 family phage prohead protease
MNELDFALQTKALDDEGHIEGLAAGYGNVDFGGDVMLRGSISKSLASQTEIPMLMYHKHDRPAGVWTEFKEVDEGLLVKGQLALGTNDGDQAHALLKRRALKGLSVGLNNVKAKFVGVNRHIHEANLHEISLVSVPMNARTKVLSVKTADALTSWVAGDRPEQRELEAILKEAFSVSNSEAERMANAVLKHRGGRDPVAEAAEFYRNLA